MIALFGIGRTPNVNRVSGSRFFRGDEVLKEEMKRSKSSCGEKEDTDLHSRSASPIAKPTIMQVLILQRMT